jgi:NTE family protein
MNGHLDLPSGFDVALVLSGGNALGAYHMGACELMLDAGVEPSRYVGASIGAVTAAILLGNPPEARLRQLRAFWDQAAQPASRWLRMQPELVRARVSNDYGLAALIAGRPGLFGPSWPGLWSMLPLMPPDLALQDHRSLQRTLERLIDFDRLNRAPQRLSIIATDMQTGDDVWFDNHAGGIRSDHLLAATALVPLLPPVRVDGRLLCDAGISNNLPLDRVLREELTRPTLCIALDLFHTGTGEPATLDQAVARMQDLAFAIQTRRSLESLVRERELMRKLDPDLPPVILGRISYRAPDFERSLKTLDFSSTVLDERAAQGRQDMARLLHKLAAAPRDAALAHVMVDDEPAETPQGRPAMSPRAEV